MTKTQLNPKIEVRKSSIEGKGVFANHDFRHGEEILQIDDSHEVKKEADLTQYQKDYIADWLPDSRVVLMQAPERYINHSCEPSSHIETEDGIRKVVASHYIRKGQEITYDYGEDFTDKYKCNCGSPKCRGIVRGSL